MKITADCILGCIRELLPNFTAAAVQSAIASLASAAPAAAGAVAAGAVAGGAIGVAALPLGLAVAFFAGQLGLQALGKSAQRREQVNLLKALDRIRECSFSTHHDLTGLRRDLAGLGYRLEADARTVRARLTQIDGLLRLNGASQDAILNYLRENQGLLISLGRFLEKNFDELRPILSAHTQRLDELTGSFAELRREVGLIDTKLDELRTIVAGGPKLRSLRTPIPANPGMVYRHRRVEMVCREPELDELLDFLASPQPVAWWLWHGPAGVGKSRLALELCRMVDRSWAGAPPEWAAGLLDTDRMTVDDWSNWRPQRPTLIVADYASGKKELLARWIADVARARDGGGLPHPVRFLLLDRDAEPRWTDSLLGPGDTAEWTKSARYLMPDDRTPAPHRLLGPIRREDLPNLVQAVYDARDQRGEKGPARPDPAVVADRFTRARLAHRPLFVALAAEAACEGRSIEHLNEEELVRGWLAEQFRQWAEIVGEDDIRSGGMMRLRSLIAVATMAQGVPAPQGYEGLLAIIEPSGAASLLPAAEPYNDPLPRLRKCVSGEADFSPGALPPLEPDYFGELFVLDHLNALDEPKHRVLVAAAARLNPAGFVRFLLFIRRDLPAHPFAPILIRQRGGMDDRAWAAENFKIALELDQLRTGDIAANKTMAIAAYEEALTIYTRDAAPSQWAMTQNNLGNAWRNMPTGDRADNLTRAIDAYEKALTIRTRDAAPSDWAMTQNNLGNAWAEMPTGDRADNLTRAIDAYEEALTIYTRDAAPSDWAATQNNLGAAWAEMPTGDRADNLTRAIDAYEKALTIRTRDAAPSDWAMTQNNLGAAWQSMPTGDRADNLTRAIDAYEEALTIYTRDAAPSDWAMTQNNLGIALADLAELPGNEAQRCQLLRRSISASKGALTIYTLEAAPHDHAATKRNLAIDRARYEALGCHDGSGGSGGAGGVAFEDIAPAE